MSKLRADYLRCSVLGCNTEHKSLHRPPALEPFRRAWMDFIFRGNIPKTVGKCLLVCANHFEDECFSNLGQYRQGFALKLHLIEGSVPTVYTGNSEDKQVRPEAIVQPLFAHKSCQTESKKTCSVGTQLSLKTLQPHFRSAGIQVTPRRIDVGVTAVVHEYEGPTSTPAKRPRLSDNEEEVTPLN